MNGVNITRGKALKYEAGRARDLAERQRLFAAAARAYAEAESGTRSTYALINAAKLHLLAGETELARQHASSVLAMLEGRTHDPDTPYWLEATRAEALLVLGDVPGARNALTRAVAVAPRAWEEHAITLRQFRLLLNETGQLDDWLEQFRVPPVIVFGGTMGLAADDDVARAAIVAAVKAIAPCEAYGALAAGADILIAEAVLRTQAELHAILPSPPDRFRRHCVEVVDPAWGERFDGCIEWASGVEVVAQGAESYADLAAFAAELAMGQAIARAQTLETSVIGLHVTAGPGGNRAIAGLWEQWDRRGLPHRQVELARTAPGLAQNQGMAAPVALVASDGEKPAVREFPNLADALAFVSAQAGGRFGLDYGFPVEGRVRWQALATALLGASAENGLRASGPAAFAARLVDPEISGELAGAVHYEGGMADFHRLYPGVR